MNRCKYSPGDKVGPLTILEKTDQRDDKREIIWKCQCNCGNICYKSTKYLRLTKYPYCGMDNCTYKKKYTPQETPADTYYVYKYVMNGEIVYIGYTKSLTRRINEHTADKLANLDCDIYYFTCKTKTEATSFEFFLIQKYTPKFNKQNKPQTAFENCLLEPKWEKYNKENNIKMNNITTTNTTTVNNNSIEIKELQMLLLENENNFLKEQNKILTQALLEKKKELC